MTAGRLGIHLEPCPFCGNTGAEINSTKPGTEKLTRRYWVNCGNDDCEATGPVKYNIKEADEAWNRRP